MGDIAGISEPEPFCEMTGPMPTGPDVPLVWRGVKMNAADVVSLRQAFDLERQSGRWHADNIEDAVEKQHRRYALLDARNVVNVRTMVMLRRCKTEEQRTAVNELCEDILQALKEMR